MPNDDAIRVVLLLTANGEEEKEEATRYLFSGKAHMDVFFCFWYWRRT
jgi:hypothetical protein